MNSFILIVAVMLMILGFVYVSLYQHEQAHVQINKYFGSDSWTEYSLTGGLTYNNGFESEDKRDLAYLSHSVNEAVAYNLIPLLVMLGVINVLGFVYLGEKMGGKK